MKIAQLAVAGNADSRTGEALAAYYKTLVR